MVVTDASTGAILAACSDATGAPKGTTTDASDDAAGYRTAY
jgi:hypothetical protein